MPDFDKLAKHADKLSSFLKDRQPGLASWSMSIGYYWNKIVEQWDPYRTIIDLTSPQQRTRKDEK